MKYSNNRNITDKSANRYQTHKDKTLHMLYLLLILSTFWHKKTGCITKIHPVFELSQARGEIVVLFVNTRTVYVTLVFRFVVNANTFSFVTIVVTTRDTINAEVVKTNVL